MLQEKISSRKYNIKHNSTRCINCNKTLRIFDDETGETLCGNCGYVILERSSNSDANTGVFLDRSGKQRTGNNISLARHDMGLSTVINPSNKDANGKTLSPEMKSSVKRLRTWEKRSNKSSDKNLQHAFSELERMSSKLVVSDAVVEKAAHIYRKIRELQITKGRNTSTFIAASLYAACRFSGTHRTLKDVQTAAGVNRRNLTKYYRLLIKEFDWYVPIVDPVQCITRIANNAGISEKTKRDAIDILEKARKHGIIDGKDPTSSAAVAIYIAEKKREKPLSLRKISSFANITQLSIRQGKKKFEAVL